MLHTYVVPVIHVVEVSVALLCIEQEDLRLAEASEREESKGRTHLLEKGKREKKGKNRMHMLISQTATRYIIAVLFESRIRFYAYVFGALSNAGRRMDEFPRCTMLARGYIHSWAWFI